MDSQLYLPCRLGSLLYPHSSRSDPFHNLKEFPPKCDRFLGRESTLQTEKDSQTSAEIAPFKLWTAWKGEQPSSSYVCTCVRSKCTMTSCWLRDVSTISIAVHVLLQLGAPIMAGVLSRDSPVKDEFDCTGS